MRWLRSETLVVTWFATWTCSVASRLSHINEQDRNIGKTNYARDLSHNLTTTPVENDDSSKEISINYSYEIQLTDGTYDPNEEDLQCLEETVRKSIPILEVEYRAENITWVGSELHMIGEEEEYSEYEGGGYVGEEEEEEEIEVSSEEEAGGAHLQAAKPPPGHVNSENWGTAIKPPPPDTKETQESPVPGEKNEIKESQKSPESNPGNNHPTHAPEKRQEESSSLIHADINENSVGEIDVNDMTKKKSNNSDSDSDSSSDSDSDSSSSDSDSSSSDSSSRSRSKRSRSRSKRSRSRSKRSRSKSKRRNSRRSGKNSKSRGRGKRGSRSSSSSSSSGGGGDRHLRARRFLQPGLTKSTLTDEQRMKIRRRRRRRKRAFAGTNPGQAKLGRTSMMVMGAANGRCQNCSRDNNDVEGGGVKSHSSHAYKLFMQKGLQKAIFSTCPTSEQYMRRGVFTFFENNQEENLDQGGGKSNQEENSSPPVSPTVSEWD